MSSYELRTIKDIFEKVPTDRIAVCCAEMAHAMIMSKTLIEGGGLTTEQVVWPDVSVWNDDGKGEIGMTLAIAETGEKVASVQFEPELKVEFHKDIQ